MAKIKCMCCNTILESKSRHDFQRCDCENEAFVDGGNDYTRYGAKIMKFVKVYDDGGNEVKPTQIVPIEKVKKVSKDKDEKDRYTYEKTALFVMTDFYFDQTGKNAVDDGGYTKEFVAFIAALSLKLFTMLIDKEATSEDIFIGKDKLH